MSKNCQKLSLEINVTELNSAQVRLIKKINVMLNNMMITEDEGDYFDSSSELLKLIAQSVKDSNFSKFWAENSKIAYADQALEFGFDSINEELAAANLVSHDN